jgi:hypothetical protein
VLSWASCFPGSEEAGANKSRGVNHQGDELPFLPTWFMSDFLEDLDGERNSPDKIDAHLGVTWATRERPGPSLVGGGLD